MWPAAFPSSRPGRLANVRHPFAGNVRVRAWTPVPAAEEESSWLDQAGVRRALAVPLRDRSVARRGPEDVISMLARAVREVEAAVERGRVTPAVRTKFQVVALLVREEHARVRAEQTSSQARRAEQLKRLDGIATILAKTAVRDPELLALLAEDAVVSDAAKSLKRDMLRSAGIEPAAEQAAPTEPAAASARYRASGRASVGRHPDSWPPRSSPLTSRGRPPRPVGPRRLAGWELLEPALQLIRAGR